MLKFNVLTNGLSRVEQKPGEKGKRMRVPRPGEPPMASGFASPCTPCFLGKEDTGLAYGPLLPHEIKSHHNAGLRGQ